MSIVLTPIKLREAYLAIAKEFNEAPKDSDAELYAYAKQRGFRMAVEALGVDWGTILIDADAAAMETYGEVPMVAGFLIK